MPRRIQPSYTKAAARQSLAAMGDSLTHNVTLGVPPERFWPERLAAGLRALGVPIQARNFGRSGNTTANSGVNMQVRFGRMTAYGAPVLGVIWGGVNDPGSGIAGATTQANLQAMAETLFTAGVRYVLIGNTQYQNYSVGGDTVSTPAATYATLRPFQQAAANALIAAHPGKVAYVDIYGFMRQKIVDGIVTQGDWAAWHVADANQHLNPTGEQYVADAMLATIQAQSGWLVALKAG